MTERRRFFPSKLAQQVPGRTVELEMQLQPQQEVVPPAGACSCDVLGVALFPDILPATGGYYEGEETPVFQTRSGIGWESVYRPIFDGWRLVGGYVPIQSPWSEMGPVLTLRALVVGTSLCDVEWAWTLDTPELPMGAYGSWWDGVTVEVQSGALKITVLSGEIDASVSDPWWASLSITASCAGTEIGQIQLRPGFNLSSAETLPAPV